jgi:[ribosomal protein S5]-alanine N-acetyltransferase
MQIILQTPRLYLRQFTEADAPLLYHLNTQPDVLKYIPEPVLTSEEHAKEVLSNIILPQYKNNLGRWAVHVKENDEFIGWCGLKLVDGEIDLGYRFLPKDWGKGYATEVAKATRLYGHQNLQLEKIIAHAHIDNIASQNVLTKIGMQFAGEGVDGGVPVKGYVSFSNNI